MRIGLVSPYQHESIIDLLCEINAYYNPASPAKREVVREHSVKNLLSPSSPHELVVAAREDGSVVGLAVVTLAYSIVEPEPDNMQYEAIPQDNLHGDAHANQPGDVRRSPYSPDGVTVR